MKAPCCDLMKLVLDSEAVSKSPTGINESIPLTRNAKTRIGYRFKVARGQYQVALFSVCPWCGRDLLLSAGGARGEGGALARERTE